MVQTFISNLEIRSGKRLIYSSVDEINSKQVSRATNEVPPLPKPQKEIFPTNITDKKLLLKTLDEYGVKYNELENGDIKCKIDSCSLTFHKEAQTSYDVEVEDVKALKNAYMHLNIIDEEYKHNVQAYTYENLIKKIETSNMNIEKEEILEDNSILLTINV